MRTIYLTRGMETQVSDVDYDRLMKHTWWPQQSKETGNWYAYTQVRRKTILMHRMITNCPDGMQVDHKDRDGLNNQRGNLRVASPRQNSSNRSFWASSGYKGVYKDRHRWRARLMFAGEHLNIGTYAEAIDAAHAYDAKAFELLGEFAYLNFRDNFDIEPADVPVYEEPDIPF